MTLPQKMRQIADKDFRHGSCAPVTGPEPSLNGALNQRWVREIQRKCQSFSTKVPLGTYICSPQTGKADIGRAHTPSQYSDV